MRHAHIGRQKTEPYVVGMYRHKIYVLKEARFQATDAAAAATIPHDVRSLSRVEEPTSLPGQSMSGQLEFPSYLSEVIQGGLIDAETVTILQVEAELLQLQAAYKQVGNRATTPELHLLSNAAT